MACRLVALPCLPETTRPNTQALLSRAAPCAPPPCGLSRALDSRRAGSEFDPPCFCRDGRQALPPPRRQGPNSATPRRQEAARSRRDVLRGRERRRGREPRRRERRPIATPGRRAAAARPSCRRAGRGGRARGALRRGVRVPPRPHAARMRVGAPPRLNRLFRGDESPRPQTG